MWVRVPSPALHKRDANTKPVVQPIMVGEQLYSIGTKALNERKIKVVV